MRTSLIPITSSILLTTMFAESTHALTDNQRAMPSSRQRTNWIIRPPQPEDKGAIEDLLQTSYGNLFAQDYDADLLQIALPRLCGVRPELLSSKTWYIAQDPQSQKIVGCGGWTPKNPFGEDIPNLRHFATHPDYLRRGIARALWNRCWEDWCEYAAAHYSNILHRPDLEVFSTLTAESFYASLGFEKVKEIIIPLGDDCPFPAILMRRKEAS